MLCALGSREYPTLNVKYDGWRVQHIDGIPACTKKKHVRTTPRRQYSFLS